MSTRSAAMLAAMLTLLFGLAAAATAAETMKAVQFDAYGAASVMHVVDRPRPQAAAGEVLVRVRAAGINPVDWKIRDGTLARYGNGLPGMLGFDAAGDIVALGQGVDGFAPGDAVIAYLRKAEAYAEYVAVPVSRVVRKPANVSYIQAAAVPTAALTAYRAMIRDGGLKRGQTVLIHAAAGGVGHFAVQIAHHAGARVIGTASAANHEFLQRLGADVVIDYRSQRFEEIAKDVDLVLDSVGGDTLARSYGVVKKGGAIVSIVAPLDAAQLEAHGIHEARGKPGSAREDLAALAQLMEQGELVPEIAAVYPLEEVVAAHRLSEAGHVRGKLVLAVEAMVP